MDAAPWSTRRRAGRFRLPALCRLARTDTRCTRASHVETGNSSLKSLSQEAAPRMLTFNVTHHFIKKKRLLAITSINRPMWHLFFSYEDRTKQSIPMTRALGVWLKAYFFHQNLSRKTKKAIRPLLSGMFCIIKVHLVPGPGVLSMDGMAKMKGAWGIWSKVH